jgi:GNAT superfamily N-acetyltransferase
MLIALYVHPDEQGRGAGAALLEHAVGEGARDLWVYEDNPGARTFYERRGWVVASEPVIEDEDWSLPVPALRYRLEP